MECDYEAHACTHGSTCNIALELSGDISQYSIFKIFLLLLYVFLRGHLTLVHLLWCHVLVWLTGAQGPDHRHCRVVSPATTAHDITALSRLVLPRYDCPLLSFVHSVWYFEPFQVKYDITKYIGCLFDHLHVWCCCLLTCALCIDFYRNLLITCTCNVYSSCRCMAPSLTKKLHVHVHVYFWHVHVSSVLT